MYYYETVIDIPTCFPMSIKLMFQHVAVLIIGGVLTIVLTVSIVLALLNQRVIRTVESQVTYFRHVLYLSTIGIGPLYTNSVSETPFRN